MTSSNGYIQLNSSDMTGEVLLAICEAADVIACECPGYLARLLRQIQSFRTYTTHCIEQFPEDAETHHWLSDRAAQVEKLLSETMLELMKKEALIDDSNRVLLDKMSERARKTALKQIGA